MKKIFLGLVALMVSVTLMAERVSVEDATLVANHFMNSAATSSLKKTTPAKRMVHKAVAEENLYYIYQNADGEGWVIVAADDAVMPILAYSETGTFRTDNMPVNIRKWMGKYNNFIRKIEDNGVAASAETQAEWKALRNGARKSTAAAVVGPLVKTTWDQDSPFNDLCPGSGTSKAYTGCVATAMAQVMNFWQWPVKGTGSHSYRPLDPNNPENYSSRYKNTLSANFGETTYDWTNMKNSYSGSYTTAQGTAVATLMYHCGVATEMMYGNDDDGGSGTYTVNYGDEEDHACAQNALWMNFGYKKSTLTGYMRDGYSYGGTTYYKKWTDSEWTAMIKEELDKQHPIMYGGAGAKGGHSFICDGYDTSNMFHFNWGWSGSNDGYYTLSNLNPGSGGAGGGDYDFSEDQDVVIGIVPDKPDVDPFEITWMANGTQFTTTTSTGTVVMPTSNPAACTGKVFVGWCNQANYSSATSAPTFVKAGDAVEEGAIFYAVFATKTEGAGEANWTLVTDASTLAVGDLLVMACTSKDATAGDISSQIMGSVSSTFSNNEISSLGEGTVQLTLGGSAGAWTLSNGNKKLGATAVKKVAWDNGTQTWSISISDGNATIQNGTESYGRFLYNANSPRFTTYTSNATAAMLLPQLYRKGAGVTYSDYSTSCENSGTAVENTEVAPKAVKIMENGQIIILRDNEKYTIFGQKIQ